MPVTLLLTDQVQTLDADGPLQKLTVTARGEIDTFDTVGVLRGETERFSPDVFLRDTMLTEIDPALRKFAREATKGAKSDLDRPHFLMRAVNEAIAFSSSAREPEAAAAAFKAKKGASGDMAHVFIAAARAVGVPARYVSGYLASEANDGARADGPTPFACPDQATAKASLDAAVATGGSYAFSADCSILLSTPYALPQGRTLSLDAAGHNVSFLGCGGCGYDVPDRSFMTVSGTLTLKGIKLSNFSRGGLQGFATGVKGTAPRSLG